MDCGRMMEAPRSLCRFPLRVRPSAMGGEVDFLSDGRGKRGPVKILHVSISTGLPDHEHRHLQIDPVNFIERGPTRLDGTQPRHEAGDNEEVHVLARRATEGEQDGDGIFE